MLNKTMLYTILFILVIGYTSSMIPPTHIVKHDLHNKLENYLNDPKFPIIINHGPAGTGKTTIACRYSIESLKKHKYEKIKITRPIVSTDETLGFLPGDLNEKMNPWLLPILDVFHEYYNKADVQNMIKNDVIEIVPFSFMRGRTFKNSIIIADEMQNSTPAQMKMLLTRLGENSKLIITGDLKQSDINYENGLSNFLNLLNYKYKNKYEIYENGFGLIEFNDELIVRHPMVKNVIKLYE